MNIFAHYKTIIVDILQQLQASGAIPSDCDLTRVTCEPPKDPEHGDISTNAAMVLAKQARQNPRALADIIAQPIQEHPSVLSCSVAGPGFINLKLSNDFWHEALQHLIADGDAYGESDMGQNQKLNVEYVSVNPTGPMHVGHARVAVVGDVMARLMEKVGYDVTREFYLNDAGTQTVNLAKSVYKIYLDLHGEIYGHETQYSGEYLIPVAEKLKAEHGDSLCSMKEDQWIAIVRPFAIAEMVTLIKSDLLAINIHHDVFTSEEAIIDKGGLDAAYKKLDDRGLIYVGQLPKPKGKEIEDWEPRDLVLFKSSEFGDDQDRPLKKADGNWTYVMGDIAYHRDKILRGFDHIINVWGTDHVGYVKRVSSAVSAMSDNQVSFHVPLCALVNFIEDGLSLKMSKRAGTFIPMQDVLTRVGADATRFMMLTRKNDIPLDFDFAKVVEKSKDNPVYYVQYAHARTASIRRHLIDVLPDLHIDDETLSQTSVMHLTEEADLRVIKVLTQWPRVLEQAAQTHEPHRIAYYLYDLASAFHGLWTAGRDHAELRFVYPDDPDRTQAKYALVRAVSIVITNGLDVFGVKALKEM